MRLWSWTAALACALVAPPVAPAQDAAAVFAEALQERYETIRDFSADFVHTYRGGVLRRQLTERGQVLIKKPGRMRWDYKTPEEKLFVSDGSTMYSYIPEDRQVIVSELPPDDSAATPALFLAGKGNLLRDYSASFVELPPDLPAGARALKLVPITPQAEYEWIVLAVDPATLALRGLSFVDPQGGTSTLAFSNLQENVGLADKLFAFSPPRGVEVVTESSGR